MFFPPFASSSSVYCNDQPNALDTAVRRCSYTLTLRVLNDSGRVNHGAEMDGAFQILSLCVCTDVFVIQQWVSWCFVKVWLRNARVRSQFSFKRVQKWQGEAEIRKPNLYWNADNIMFVYAARWLCYLPHFLHYTLVLLIMYLISERVINQGEIMFGCSDCLALCQKYGSSFHFSLHCQLLCHHQSVWGAFYGDKCIWVLLLTVHFSFLTISPLSVII